MSDDHPGDDQGDELPDDLAALERELSAGQRTGDGDVRRGRVLRDRVLRAMARESGRRGPVSRRWLAAAAAAVLVWMNLSMSVVNNTDGGLRRGMAQNGLAQNGLAQNGLDRAEQRVLELAPELSGREARRQALIVLARARSTPSAVPVPPGFKLTQER
jgi:hypothetical protein